MPNQNSAHEKVDVVVVGSGASGSTYAAALAKAGKKVVVLDNGPDWKLTDLISSDIWGRRIKPAGGPILLGGKNQFAYANQGAYAVGGAALHYFAQFPRYLPTDFKMKSEHNRGHDWPIGYEDLAPYYDQVAADVGVSGDAKAEEKWRPAGKPYPMPPMKIFPAGKVWLKGAQANGIDLIAMANGMNSTEFKGRAACIYDGWCHVGCPIGALANPIVTYLGEAQKAGAEVRALSNVTRVLTDQTGTRAIGVEYYDAQKQRQVQEASVVVLAAWSAQNPRILLNSATDKHPNGLANSNKLVGKFMMTHHIAGTWALFDEDITPHMGTVGGQFMSYDRYAKTSYPGAFGSSFITAGTSHKTNDYAMARGDLFGPELAAYMKRAARGLSHMTIFGEGLPHAENRVELVSDKDEYGYPMARLIHSFDDDAIALWNANFDQGMKIAKATDAKQCWPGKGPVVPTSHLHGGAIMGTDSSNSVTNSYGQTHEVANLWMAGPCIFPTEGASNPTYTIFATALRGAEHLAKTWGSVAG
jgi:choline dehydrogenase-like flavoprotein